MLTGLVCAVACAGCSYFRGGNSQWTPSDSPLAQRGPEVSRRFGLERLFQISVRVNNAFLPSNRRAMARLEARLAKIPGVDSVAGPAGLQTFLIDENQRARGGGPLLDPDPDAAVLDEDAVQALRRRVERRADATGWFVSRGGSEIRFLIEAERIGPLRSAIATALGGSGLNLLDGDDFQVTPVLPRPDRHTTPYEPWVLLGALLLVTSLFAVPALHHANPDVPRIVLAALVAGLAAASLGVFAPVVPLRRYAIMAGLGVGIWVMVVAWVMSALAPPRAAASPFHVPGLIGVPAASLVILLLAAWPRLGLATRVWQPSSLLFVSVRAALDEPVVMREVRRMTEFIRAQPGVADAWSIADTVEATPWAGVDRAGIPDDAVTLRGLLSWLRSDSAARLQLSADHGEALVVVRRDDAAGIEPIALHDRIARYLENEQRATLARVDLTDAALPLPARGFARGILAADGRTRVLRTCARFGRNLDDEAVATTLRLIRQGALAPPVDLPSLRVELGSEVQQLLEAVVLAERDVPLPSPAVRQRLVGALAAEPWQSSVADISAIVSAAGVGKRLEGALHGRLLELRSRLATARRSNAGRLAVKSLLAEIDLPQEGPLSEEVRDATLEAMGPIVGVPVAPSTSGAFTLDSFVVGGAAQDAALSRAWLPRLWLGMAASGLLVAIVLLLMGGVGALGWWPAALGPAAAAFAAPAIGAVSLGIWPIIVAAGALAGGAAFAVVLAPGWVDS